MILFFLGGDDILQCLGGEGLDDPFGWDLDGGAGLRVAADAGLAGPDLNGDKAGEGELVSFFDSFGGQLAKPGQDYSGLLTGKESLQISIAASHSL